MIGASPYKSKQNISSKRRLIAETEAAREAAVENARFLAPLSKYLEPFMNPPEYQSLPDTFTARSSLYPLCFHSHKRTFLLLDMWLAKKAADVR